MNVPVFLTLIRIAAAPLIVFFYYWPRPWAHPLAGTLFALAALTDWLDGYLARVWHQMTPLGAFLDPVADKLLVSIALVIVLPQHPDFFLPIATAIIIGREIMISALREWMAEMGKRASVAVNFVGKLKTVLQMVAVTLLLWYHPGTFGWVVWLGPWLLYVAAALTLWSMIIYLRLAWQSLSQP